jgi:hypothetical protein
MATIQIADLNTTVEYAELSDLELESIAGGKQTNDGPTVTGEASINFEGEESVINSSLLLFYDELEGAAIFSR